MNVFLYEEPNHFSLNRTILELKLAFRWWIGTLFSASQSHHTGIEMNKWQLTKNKTNKLSIAPYWNWNELVEQVTVGRIYSQSHHTRIEITKNSLWYMGNMTLSIAPYWNWNLSSAFSLMSNHDSLNRTILELKWITYKLQIGDTVALNRTILELKLLLNKLHTPFVTASQSHHTGIEIYVAYHLHASLHNSQSHHTGIEITYVEPFCGGLGTSQSHHTGIEINKQRFNVVYWTLLSIAPYWNWNNLG